MKIGALRSVQTCGSDRSMLPDFFNDQIVSMGRANHSTLESCAGMRGSARGLVKA